MKQYKYIMFITRVRNIQKYLRNNDFKLFDYWYYILSTLQLIDRLHCVEIIFSTVYYDVPIRIIIQCLFDYSFRFFLNNFILNIRIKCFYTELNVIRFNMNKNNTLLFDNNLLHDYDVPTEKMVLRPVTSNSLPKFTKCICKRIN